MYHHTQFFLLQLFSVYSVIATAILVIHTQIPEVSLWMIKFHHTSNLLPGRVIYFVQNTRILFDINSVNKLYDISTRKFIYELPAFFAKVTNESNRTDYSQD